jgi:hypothetical protein
MFIITSWMGYYNMRVQRMFLNTVQAIRAQTAPPGQRVEANNDDHDADE